MYDVEAVRRDFPILSREVHGRPLVYLDNGASAQKPQAVIDAVTNAYAHEYANVHRGLHYLSSVATEKYEATRRTVQAFLGAAEEEEIVFTTGSTMAINLVSYAWAAPRLEGGRRDRALGDGAPRQHRPLALPPRAAGRGAEVGRHRARRQPRPGEGPRRHRPAHQARRRHPHVERPRHHRRREGDLRRRPRRRRAGARRRQPGGGPHAGGRPRPRRRLLRDHRPQALWPDRLRRALRQARAPGADAALPRRRRHDPRGPQGGDHLRRPAAALRGGHALDRRDDRPRGRARLHDRPRPRRHRRPRGDACATTPSRGCRASTG